MGNCNVKRNKNEGKVNLEKTLQAVGNRKIKNIMELPDEMLQKILSKLSKYDILQNVAHVSKKFRELARDPIFIGKLEFFPDPLMIESLILSPKRELKGLTEKEQKEYFDSFLHAFRICQNLKFLSLDFHGWDCGRRQMECDFLAELPSARHEFLEELHLNGHFGMSGLMDILQYQCPNLKILKLEGVITARSIPQIFEYMLKPGIFNGFDFCHFKDLEVLDLKLNRGTYELTDQEGKTDHDASEKLLNCLRLTKINFPNLQTLRLSAFFDFHGPYWVFIPERQKFLDAISQLSLEMGITIEINPGKWT